MFHFIPSTMIVQKLKQVKKIKQKYIIIQKTRFRTKPWPSKQKDALKFSV